MHSATRTKLIVMPLIKLRKLRSDLDSLIREVETAPRREIDIAAEHSGRPAIDSRGSRTEGHEGSQKMATTGEDPLLCRTVPTLSSRSVLVRVSNKQERENGCGQVCGKIHF
jgi:hypothetical protein